MSAEDVKLTTFALENKERAGAEMQFLLEGMPPLCILHGVDDELVPFNQSVMLAEEMERRGMPHEFYSYEGLKHYFSTSADNATTQQMFRDSVDCLRRGLNAAVH